MERADVKVAIEGGELVIRIPVETKPQLSKSGKSLIVASSHGTVATKAMVDGKQVYVGVNAFVYP